MSNKNFNIHLRNSVDSIQNFLNNENVKFSLSGSSMTINIADSQISDLTNNIDHILSNNFKHKKKPFELYKYNYFRDKFYLQFKRA